MKEFEIAKKVGKELTQEEMVEAAAKAMGIPELCLFIRSQK